MNKQKVLKPLVITKSGIEALWDGPTRIVVDESGVKRPVPVYKEYGDGLPLVVKRELLPVHSGYYVIDAVAGNEGFEITIQVVEALVLKESKNGVWDAYARLNTTHNLRDGKWDKEPPDNLMPAVRNVRESARKFSWLQARAASGSERKPENKNRRKESRPKRPKESEQESKKSLEPKQEIPIKHRDRVAENGNGHAEKPDIGREPKPKVDHHRVDNPEEFCEQSGLPDLAGAFGGGVNFRRLDKNN